MLLMQRGAHTRPLQRHTAAASCRRGRLHALHVAAGAWLVPALVGFGVLKRTLLVRRAAKAPARPQDAPPTWPPPKPAERAKREQPLLWVRGRAWRCLPWRTRDALALTLARVTQGTNMRKSHDGERVQFDALDLTLEKAVKMAVVGASAPHAAQAATRF
jgi:hypothetical protein